MFGALVTGVTCLVYQLLKRRSASIRTKRSTKRLLSEASCAVPFYSYREIERATDGFSDAKRLGTGAYGTVYAGRLGDSRLVAVKRIRQRDNAGLDRVMNEVKLVSCVCHRNLVRLLGCCIEQGQQILVYEFMPNGTLAQHLQRERGPAAVPWTVRLRIAAETAKAIAYLHSEVDPPIYHATSSPATSCSTTSTTPRSPTSGCRGWARRLWGTPPTSPRRRRARRGTWTRSTTRTSTSPTGATSTASASCSWRSSLP